MKHLKQFLLMAMLLFTLAPLQVSAKENIDVKVADDGATLPEGTGDRC